MSRLNPQGRHAKKNRPVKRGLVHVLAVLACLPVLLDVMPR